MKRTLIGLVAAGLMATGVGFSSPAQATTADITSRMLAKHNAARATKCGSNSLVTTAGLNNAAQHHSDDMARYNYVSHTLHDGTTWYQNIKNYSTWPPGGENIAAGQTSVNEVFDSWMASADHKRNIMDCSFKHMGVGYATDTDSVWGTFWTVTFAY